MTEIQRTTMSYDSTKDTLEHIKLVNKILLGFAKELMDRAIKHDSTKLQEPEKSGFDVATQKLKDCEYDSPEYKKSLEELKPILDHHYRNNSHHPEFYENGVSDMDLLDLLEMFADWRAAGERNKGGNIFNSINKNRERFKMSDQLTSIFKRTAERFGEI